MGLNKKNKEEKKPQENKKKIEKSNAIVFAISLVDIFKTLYIDFSNQVYSVDLQIHIKVAYL